MFAVAAENVTVEGILLVVFLSHWCGVLLVAVDVGTCIELLVRVDTQCCLMLMLFVVRVVDGVRRRLSGREGGRVLL